MSMFGNLIRSTAAAGCVAIGAGSATAQPYTNAPPAVYEGAGVPGYDPVTAASGFGRPPRTAVPCSPYAPCPPATYPAPGVPMVTPGMPPGMMPPSGVMPPGMNPPSVPQPAPQAPDFGDLAGGAGVGPGVGRGGYIENAAPTTMARLRFDSGYNNNRPDRGAFFYAKCGCFRPAQDAEGPPLPERQVDYQELTSSVEFAISQRFSAFVDVPVRFINPDLNQNASGISDIGFGGKYAFVYNESRIVSFFLRFQAPAGSISKGLGNGNWWVEPGLLYLEQLSDKWQVFGEFRYQAPLGERSDFVGDRLRYGIGTSYTVAQGCWGYVAPVAELVGWSVLSGKQLDPDQLAAVSASGDTIVNAKLGVRIGFGATESGSPYPTRSDLYLGYGRALTGEVWYKEVFRVEYRLFY